MNISTAQSHSRGLKRPYWLLLVLALFLGGQVASAGHWHDITNTIDNDCALCVLSSATSGAITASGWQAPAIALFTAVFVYFLAPLRRSVTRFHDSRAPPLHC